MSVKWILRVKQQFQEQGSWFLVHNNAPAGSAMIGQHFLNSIQLTFLIPKLKTVLNRRKFQDIKDIKENITAKLNTVSLYAIDDCFTQLLETPRTFVAVGGGYFERKCHVNNILFISGVSVIMD